MLHINLNRKSIGTEMNTMNLNSALVSLLLAPYWPATLGLCFKEGATRDV